MLHDEKKGWGRDRTERELIMINCNQIKNNKIPTQRFHLKNIYYDNNK